MILFLTSLLLFWGSNKSTASPSNERTIAVARTPESTTIVLKIAFPKNQQLMSAPVWIQFRIDGFALGAASQFERAEEVAVSKMGQTIHVVIDNHPYFPINEPAIDPFSESSGYYDTSYKFEIPYRLDNGMHTIRMFPARSFGESLKGEGTYAAIQFYIGSKTNDPNIDLSAPYITYNEPSPLMPLTADQPILLDFYLSNAELSPDGYKVRLSIDGTVNRLLTSWQPYYIYGLKSGSHTIRLELVDSENKRVPGLFNDVTETIILR